MVGLSMAERRAAQIRYLAKRLRAHGDLARRFELVLSVPGIGERTALAIVIRMPELGRVSRTVGSEGRMNTPAAGEGNWTWRYSRSDLRPEIAAELAKLMEMTDRDGYVAPKDSIAGAPD